MESRRFSVLLPTVVTFALLFAFTPAEGVNVTLLEGCGRLPGISEGNASVLPEQVRLPWRAAIYERRNGSLPYICEGILVYQNIVLTTASCFLRTKDPEQFEIVLNSAHGNLTQNAADKSTIFADVDRIVLHPKYKPSAGYVNNIALVRVVPRKDNEEHESRPGPPVCIPSERAHPGDIGQVFGAYYDPKDNQTVVDLVGTNVTVLAGRKCIQLTNDAPAKGQFCVLATQIPVPLRQIGSGPFIEKQDEQYFLKGILSQGSETIKDIPVFVTSVPDYSDWIGETIDEINSSTPGAAGLRNRDAET